MSNRRSSGDKKPIIKEIKSVAHSVGTTQQTTSLYTCPAGDRTTLARIVGSLTFDMGADTVLTGAIVVQKAGVAEETIDLADGGATYPNRPEDVLWHGTLRGAASTVETFIVDVKGKRKLRPADGIKFKSKSGSGTNSNIAGSLTVMVHKMG